MKVEFHTGIVTDDVHRVKGAVVPDGGLELRVPSYSGHDREGWDEHKIRWIKPLFTRYYEIPKVDQRVTVLVYESGEVRWMPWVPETDIPAWMQGHYPYLSGIQSRSGTLQIAFDETPTDGFLHLGKFDAPTPITLWTQLKAMLTGRKSAYDPHTHSISVATLVIALAAYFLPNPGPPPPPVPPVGTVTTGGPSATMPLMNDNPMSTTTKGV